MYFLPSLPTCLHACISFKLQHYENLLSQNNHAHTTQLTDLTQTHQQSIQQLNTQISTLQTQYKQLEHEHIQLQSNYNTLQSNYSDVCIERDHYHTTLQTEQRKQTQQMQELQTLQQLLSNPPLHANLTLSEKV